jgi:hypothetical protein
MGRSEDAIRPSRSCSSPRSGGKYGSWHWGPTQAWETHETFMEKPMENQSWTGLTEDQAREFHAAFMRYFVASVILSAIAHVLVAFAAGGWYTVGGG